PRERVLPRPRHAYLVRRHLPAPHRRRPRGHLGPVRGGDHRRGGQTVTQWVVLKFGGTSVSSLERWETIATECRARIADGLRPVVVCSAVRGVSDQLGALPDHAVRGDHEALLSAIAVRHAALAAELGVDPAVVADDLDALRRLATGVAMVG